MQCMRRFLGSAQILSQPSTKHRYCRESSQSQIYLLEADGSYRLVASFSPHCNERIVLLFDVESKEML